MSREERMSRVAETISIAVAADESYSVALCIAIYTLLENLSSEIKVDLYIMANDIQSLTRNRLERAWGERVQPHWISPDGKKIRALVAGTGHTSCLSVYYRLLVGSSLPASLTKVIYLDLDIMVVRDVYPLWRREMNGNIVLAVQDSCIQTNRRNSAIEESGSYFNSGLMVIDLSAWRREGLEARCLKSAQEQRRLTRYNEQAALNDCLAGRWGLLPPVWNRQATIDLFPDWQSSPYEEEEFRQLRQNPAIIHFTTATKPWQRICDHPKAYIEAYEKAIVRAGWMEWQSPPLSAVQKAIEFFAQPHRRLLHLGSAVLQAKRRRHAGAAMLPQIFGVALHNPWAVFTVLLAAARDKVALWLIR
jgi:lipopolysaccharide biosynthesis glycosyltransferase